MTETYTHIQDLHIGMRACITTSVIQQGYTNAAKYIVFSISGTMQGG